MKALQKIINKSKNGESVPHLEITKVVLVYCNIVNNYYQQNSRALFTFLPNKSFGRVSYIEVWFTDQNSKPLEIEGKLNITSVIN